MGPVAVAAAGTEGRRRRRGRVTGPAGLRDNLSSRVVRVDVLPGSAPALQAVAGARPAAGVLAVVTLIPSLADHGGVN